MKGIFVVCVLSVFVTGWLPVSADDGHTRLDVFHEVLEKLNVTGTVLPESKVEEFFDGVLHRFSCVENGTALPGFESETQLNTCPEKLCLNITDLFRLVNGNPLTGLTEEQFHEASVSALYALSRGKHPCGSTLAPGARGVTVEQIQMKLMMNMSAGGYITEETLETFLHELGEVYAGIEHDHEDDHEDDHADDHADEDDHSDHDHRRRKRESDDDHDDHDDDKPSVVESKCLAPDSIMYYLNVDDDVAVSAPSRINDVATVVVYLMYQAAAIEEECRMLPRKTDFVKALITKVMGGSGNLTVDGFFQLMHELNIIPSAQPDSGDDHSGHDHRRKRRSVPSDVSRDVITVSRAKRQATVESNLKCYSPQQLMAVFETGATITPELMTQLSPALIYQKLYTQCVAAANSTDVRNTHEIRWLYGTITVVIVCLCSLGGVVLLPCMKKQAYQLGMALFVGLAVGSLTGDALLHLIPATMGAHQHSDEGHDHAHGDEIVVEKYVWFALATLAGLYAFFLLETLFTRCLHHRNVPGAHGHSHSFDLDGFPAKTQDDDKPENKGNISVSIMIILGDALHNFADGLAIGAAFSASNSVGIATGIAVFCHELPHELGDFAVLLKNGMTVKKAVFWNLVSSLTALLGLYVSLAVATSDEVQTWIFAVAAGMFLYIAMADLMPQMIAHENSGETNLFVMNNIGMLLGTFIMLLIAIFEERIVIN